MRGGNSRSAPQLGLAPLDLSQPGVPYQWAYEPQNACGSWSQQDLSMVYLLASTLVSAVAYSCSSMTNSSNSINPRYICPPTPPGTMMFRVRVTCSPGAMGPSGSGSNAPPCGETMDAFRLCTRRLATSS